MLNLGLPPAKCAVCIASETPHGGWWLAGIVLVLAVAGAVALLWADGRGRR